MENRTDAHEEERLIENAADRVSDAAIDGQGGADARPDDHESELAVQRIGQHAAQVVLGESEEDRKERHRRADIDQQFRSREAAQQRIDGQLGREDGEDHRSRYGRGRIGVMHPVMQQRKGAFDAEGDEDRPCGKTVELHAREGDGTGIEVEQDDTCHENDARSHLDDEIAHAGGEGTFGAAGPDEEDGCDGRAFPENEEGDEIVVEASLLNGV